MLDRTVADTVTGAAITLLFAEMMKEAPHMPLSRLCLIHNGQGLRSGERIEEGQVEVFGAGGVVGKHDKALHSGPFVVIGRKGSAGKATYAPNGGWVTDTAYFGTPLNPSEFRCQFLYYALRSLDFSSDIISTAIPGINRTAIYRHRVPKPSAETQDAVVAFLDALSEGRTEPNLPELPASLAEQGRTVVRIEELAAKIGEAKALRGQVEAEQKRMLSAVFSSTIKDTPRQALGEVAPIVRRAVAVDASADYPELGIRSFGKGTFHKPPVSGGALGSKRLFRIDAGDLVFNNVFAWEGAVAVARPEDAGRFGSHRFITCVPRPGVCTSRFLCFFFLTTEGISLLGEASPGGAWRNRTLGLEALSRIHVPMPDYRRQVWFDELQSELDALRRLQAETSAELDALLPSILDKAFKGEL